MDLRLALAGVLIVGYVGYKGFERSGGKLPFGLDGGMGRRRSLAPRRPPAPEKLAFERVTLDATEANLPGFIRLTGNLERLGFRIVADYAIAGWPDTTCRGFVHRDKPVHAAIVERRGLPAHVELFTLFDDLSGLITSASEEAGDRSKPLALRFQQIPGLTVDELFVQHISSLENLYQDQLNAKPALRLTYFEHQRALLVIEHELRKAKRALRKDSLTRSLDVLPALPVEDLLKRYGLETTEPIAVKTVPAQAPSEPPEAPKKWGIGSSLLSKRLAARQDEDVASSDAVSTLVLEPKTPATPGVEPAATREVTVEKAAPVLASEPEPAVLEPEAIAPLPFEVAPEEPVADPEAPAGSKPTCPHCGATLFSSLSSRCSKCKQAVR